MEACSLINEPSKEYRQEILAKYRMLQLKIVSFYFSRLKDGGEKK